MRRVCLETDQNGRALQSLAPNQIGVQLIAIGGTSVRVPIPTESQVVRIAATGNCYVAFGDNSIVATSSHMLFPVGVELFTVKPTWTHVAVIAEAGATGNVSISDMS
jgi:hypothetical protein